MQPNAIPQMHQPLTEREKEVANLLVWGFTDKEVAVQLGISVQTARTHHSNINIKTQSRNLADLTRWYMETSLQVSMGKKPKLRKIMSVAALILLVGICEMIQVEAIRANRASIRTAKVSRSGKQTKKNTLILS